ncbi:MAG: hypothetical protein RE471_08930 [Ferroplasma sp.]|uniref:hypothetical protein n=1 Tax=Ferroplasma sp. TaxID=2591003 RepID=UPI0028169AC4|nr:hypothetical protein [Ferroplasma sp.]WMT51087.1 MAG: hypothetical protein RE471_08930 [Ferroplasma sp.]
MEYEVEVLSVQRVIDLVTGKPRCQVTFGVPNEITEKISARLTEEQKESPEIYSNIVSISTSYENGKLYQVSSKWKITINKNGDINISKSV